MKQQTRPPEPQILITFGPKWTDNYVRRRGRNPSARHYWPALPKNVRLKNKERLNHRLLPLLNMMSDHCCSFCDVRPVQGIAIEHHKPKSVFDKDAFRWDNLFLCCPDCNGRKLERYHPLLLKPDVEGYSFERYFIWEFESGKLKVNPLASKEDQKAARLTICFYNLNSRRLTNHRRGQRRIWINTDEAKRDIADFSYPAYILA